MDVVFVRRRSDGISAFGRNSPRFYLQAPGRLSFVLFESGQRDRTEEPGKQVVARRFLTFHQTKMVGRADHRGDFVVAVYHILGAAQLPWNSKAGRAIDADGVAHIGSLLVSEGQERNYSICAFLALFSVISTASRMA
jgi:hypothetical protein